MSWQIYCLTAKEIIPRNEKRWLYWR